MPGGPPIIDQHVLPGRQPGLTYAQACVLDHVAAVRSILDAFSASAAVVTVTIADAALELADCVWTDQDEGPTP